MANELYPNAVLLIERSDVRTSLKIWSTYEGTSCRLYDPGSFIRRADEVDYAERHEYDHHKNWIKNDEFVWN